MHLPTFLDRAKPSVAWRLAATLTALAILGTGSPAAAIDPAFTIVGTYDSSEVIFDCTGYIDPVSQNPYALLAAGLDGVVVLNLSDPTQPAITGRVALPGVRIWDVKVHDHYAYGVPAQGPTLIVDLTQPESPALADTFRTQAIPGAQNLTIDGNLGYFAVGGTANRDLRIVNLSNPVAPQEVGSWAHPQSGQPAVETRDLHIAGDRGILAYLAGGFVILDLTDPIQPALESLWSYPGASSHNAWPLPDQPDIVLTTDEFNPTYKLQAWDASTLPPAFVSAPPEDNPHDVVCEGNLAYCACFEGGMRVWDMRIPSQPVVAAEFDSLNVWQVYPFAPGDHVYLAHTTGFMVLNFANPIGVQEPALAPAVTWLRPAQNPTPRPVRWVRAAGGGRADIAIYSAGGRFIHRLRLGAGSTAVTWSGVSAWGQPVANGTYYYLARGEGIPAERGKFTLHR